MNEPSSNRFTRARTKGGVLAVIAVLALIVAAPTGAGQARHLAIEIHESFPSAFLSNACKTDVVVSFDATLNVTLVYNQAGLLVKEVDPSGGGRVTYSAPLTGNSFSFPFQTTIIDYGAGATVGSTFTMKLVGLFGHVPGIVASDAGQLIVSGVVEGFDENGSPQLEITDFVREHGNRESGDDVTAAICTALTA
jgi:predicted aconitase with swiveling domain